MQIDCQETDLVRWAEKPVRKADKNRTLFGSSAQRWSEFGRFPPLSRLSFEISGRSLDLFCLLFCVKTKRVSGLPHEIGFLFHRGARAKPSYYGLPTTPPCGHPSNGGEFAARWIVGCIWRRKALRLYRQSRNLTDSSLRIGMTKVFYHSTFLSLFLNWYPLTIIFSIFVKNLYI